MSRGFKPSIATHHPGASTARETLFPPSWSFYMTLLWELKRVFVKSIVKRNRSNSGIADTRWTVNQWIGPKMESTIQGLIKVLAPVLAGSLGPDQTVSERSRVIWSIRVDGKEHRCMILLTPWKPHHNTFSGLYSKCFPFCYIWRKAWMPERAQRLAPS